MAEESNNSYDGWDLFGDAVDFYNAKYNDSNPTQTTSTVENAPWDGIQPYLTGNDSIAGRWDHPVMNYNNMAWNDAMANGASPSVAPPMFMDDQRLTGHNVAIPTDVSGHPVYQDFRNQPQPPQQFDPVSNYVPDFSNGPTGNGFGGTGIDLREQMATEINNANQPPRTGGIRAPLPLQPAIPPQPTQQFLPPVIQQPTVTPESLEQEIAQLYSRNGGSFLKDKYSTK